VATDRLRFSPGIEAKQTCLQRLEGSSVFKPYPLSWLGGFVLANAIVQEGNFAPRMPEAASDPMQTAQIRVVSIPKPLLIWLANATVTNEI
jgi:hypothetical protein